MSTHSTADEGAHCLLDLKDSDSLSFFVRDIKKFPMLEAEEEYQLARQWHENKDQASQTKILGSHLRLVYKIAKGYRGYGLAMHDLVAEGNIGLMQALNKFDPDKGFRFSTYASWWIKAAVQDYILKNWSMVKIGTTLAQKKLFFGLKRMQRHLSSEGLDSTDDAVHKIATQLGVKHTEVSEMSMRLATRDASLNAPISKADDSKQWQDWLEADDPSQEEAYFHRQEMHHRRTLLKSCIQSLDQRASTILKYRRLHEPPKTLDELAQTFNVSKERVRQIEASAFQNLQKEVRKRA